MPSVLNRFIRIDQPAPTARIRPGCVVTVAHAGPGDPDPRNADRRYLVHDIDEDAGLALLGCAIGDSGCFDPTPERAARLDDLTMEREPAGVTPMSASAPGARADLNIPPREILDAYRTLCDWLNGHGTKAA